MWSFTKVALDLLAACVAEAAGKVCEPDPALLSVTEDRYGGVEIEVSAAAADADQLFRSVAQFERELRQGLESWQAAGKRGVWLKLPLARAKFVSSAVTLGFQYHHAKPDYVLLTRWLPATPSKLPLYAFTQVGVGGIVVNSRKEVLMVKERVATAPMFQGSWKLPGGLADPDENFVETAQREVREETGVTGSLDGVVSLRHSHGYRFGQDDIYVVVKLRAENEAINIDTHELSEAQWMSLDMIASLVQADPRGSLDGKVSANNWKVIAGAFEGTLIVGNAIPNPRWGKSSMIYTAAPVSPSGPS